MPSIRLNHITLFLIVGSLLGIFIISLIRLINENRCRFKDTRICSFISKYKKEPYRYSSGLLEQTVSGQTYTGSWAIAGNIEKFSIVQSDTPVLDMVLSSDFIFLKDNASDVWWRQSQNDARKYNIDIPFNPFSFFKSINDYLVNDQTEFAYIQSLSCGLKQCYRYQLKNPDLSNRQLFLYIQDDFSLYRAVSAENNNVLDVVVNSYKKQQIESPKNIKETTSQQNLFLEWTKQQSEQEKKLDYLNEFQQDRQETESQGSLQNVPQFVENTPTPITSVISPSP